MKKQMRKTAENIEIKRRQLNLKQSELCAKILMSESKYRRCIKNNNFTLNEIDLIAKVLKTSPSVLAYSSFVLKVPFE